MKARSRTEEDYLSEQMGRMAPCDLCIITLPKSLFVQLSNEAAKRNMTFAQFMAAAIDSYLLPKSDVTQAPQPPAQRQQEPEHSNFELPRHLNHVLFP